jgi:diguanylate cyclase (GGDEF)-like protein
LRSWMARAGTFLLAGMAVAADGGSTLDPPMLESAARDVTSERVLSGALDGGFMAPSRARLPPGIYWMKLPPSFRGTAAGAPQSGVPVIVVTASRQSRVDLFAGGAAPLAFPRAVVLPGFRGYQHSVFAVQSLAADRTVYARVDTNRGDTGTVSFTASTLSQTLAQGAEHARMISWAFGALAAMALSAFLIWLILADKLFILYATLFSLQALYVAFLSGQGFDWPVLSYAAPLTSFAWNVPVGLSGAVACLFTREIADLKHFWPRIHKAFGWLAGAFVLVTVGNVAKLYGFGPAAAAVGNVVFFVAAVFTMVVAFMSWRRGNRAAGWFLIAWTLLEGFTIAAAVRFLATASAEIDTGLYYYGLPLSMVAAAVLIALGVADRLREQRAALTDAERRAQTDPLTGVLNRRSLIERLEAACLRARARGLPIALLFIDLDHFKFINDTFGHQAGDDCLRAIIAPIHTELRQSDVIGRYGGDEFVVILSSADAAAAHPIALRILERVANARVGGYGPPIGLTCSIGVAASDTLGVWGEHLIARADAAVYRAKRAGRNQVQMAA